MSYPHVGRRRIQVGLILAAVLFATPIALAPAPSQAADERLPVIFLHGFTGAFLSNPSGEVWPNEGDTARSLSDSHFNVLRLQADGRTPFRPNDPAYQITVDRGDGIDGIIDQVELCLFTVCAGVSDVYGSTFTHLEDRGYRRGEDLVAFAFDWRLDTDTNAQLLLDEIDDVLSRTGAPRVNLVAHSQGGLIVRAALNAPRSVGKVARVATVGTPVLGVTRSLGVLDYREPCQSVELFGACVINRAKAQQLVTNWPGALALLPSAPYYQAYLSPIRRLVDDDGDGQVEGYLSPAQVRAKLADRNLGLIDAAASLHGQIDEWSPAEPTIQLTQFVGTGLGSIERIEEFLTERCTGAWWWRSCTLVESFRMQYGDGDGTVAIHAADVYDPSTGLDLRGGATNSYVAGVGHGDLVKDPAVLDAVVDVLDAPSGQTTASGPATSEAGAGMWASLGPLPAAASQPAKPPRGVRRAPKGLTGLEVTALGPVAGLVRDSRGRRTGADRASRPVTEQIPGSSVATGENNATVFLTRDGGYRAAWTAAKPGDVTLQLRTYRNDRARAIRSIGPVHVDADAHLRLDVTVPGGMRSPRLLIDDDADGAVDRMVKAHPPARGSAADDRLAPQVSVATRPRGRDEVEVTVDASDRGGAGVAQVEYALDASDTSATYDGPFVAPARGTLIVRAVDRAGNVTAPYVRVPLR